MKDILDLHTHTIASGHAYNTLYEMAQAAAIRDWLFTAVQNMLRLCPVPAMNFILLTLKSFQG